MAIGFKIKKVREIQGVKQNHISSELGLSQATYSRIESAKGDPKFSILEKIAAILNVHVEDIVGFTEGINFNLTNNKNATGVTINQMSQSERKLYESYIESLKAEIFTLNKIVDSLLNLQKQIKTQKNQA